MPHLGLKLLVAKLAIARETRSRLIQLLGSLSQVKKDNAPIHNVVEREVHQSQALSAFGATTGVRPPWARCDGMKVLCGSTDMISLSSHDNQ